MPTNKTWHLLEGELIFVNAGISDTANRHPSRKKFSFWTLVIMQRGQRTLLLNGEEVRVGAHEFFLLPPYTDHDPLEYDDHTACYFHFSMSSTNAEPPPHVDASKILLPTTGVLPSGIDCFAYAQILENHYISPYADRTFLTLQLRALLSLLSLECQKNPNCEEHGTLAEQTLHYIQKNSCTALRSQDYEKNLNRSYHHINQVFKDQFGCTVKQYHMRLRMDHAAQMLRLGKSLQDTARDCGFDDYFYFINSFTKAHGLSPAAYSRHEKML